VKQLLLVLLLFVAIGATASAHEVCPAYLDIRENDVETYGIVWKVPARGEMRLGLYVEFPADCATVTEPRALLANDALTERWSVRRAGGLTGATIRIARLAATATWSPTTADVVGMRTVSAYAIGRSRASG
jgi:hypothetical protein